MAIWSNISKTELIESKLRLDADFYKPEFLQTKELIIKNENVPFRDAIDILTDYHANGSYETLRDHVTLLDEKEYAYVVRTTDLETNNFTNDVKYFDKSAYDFLKKSKVFGGEIIINKIGSAGKVYLMPYLNKPVSLGMNQFLIRCKDGYKTNYIYAFLISKYGEKLIRQQVNGTVPMTITKEGVRNVLIPTFNSVETNLIDDLIERHLALKTKSKAIYQEAINILEQELNLDKIIFKKRKNYIANFSEVVIKSRSDADYFQTKYRQLEEHINSIETVSLSSICTFLKGFEVGTPAYTEVGPTFFRVSNLTKEGFAFGNSDKYISEETYKSLKLYQPKIGDILLTKDGTIGTCYVVDEYVEGIISSGIMNLNLFDKKIPKEYLVLVINSKLCQMQAERECSGALITHWKPEQIRNLKIPVLKKETMNQLSELCSKSKVARKESKRLLEEAKNRVEQLIEEAANKN
jgi:type I restriction enzyme S subunit